MRLITNEFATFRGLVRAALADAERLGGRLRPYQRIDFAAVRRLVFVCQGNICRSCFGEYVAKRRGLPAASFGIAATAGNPAFKGAIRIAKEFGIDLGSHRVSAYPGFEILPGDLLLVMEVRQARKLDSLVRALPGVQLSLTGLWASPKRTHIHDPFEHDDHYFRTCYRVISSAVDGLERNLRRHASDRLVESVPSPSTPDRRTEEADR